MIQLEGEITAKKDIVEKKKTIAYNMQAELQSAVQQMQAQQQQQQQQQMQAQQQQAQEAQQAQAAAQQQKTQ